ncbi:MAG: 4-hydroxybenzoate octaprenyltransferase [Hyphomicrobiales bacterium]
MRAAGCTYNDIVDRDIDAGVARTRSRPLPSGQVTVTAAVIFMLALCLVGLAVLLSLNTYSIVLGFAVVPIVMLYPFVKRISNWPQAVLGLAFNWGARSAGRRCFGRPGSPRPSCSMRARSPGPSATTPSTRIRTARTTS